MDSVTKSLCYRRLGKTTLLQVVGVCPVPKYRYSSKCFAQIFRGQYGVAILVELCAPPTWRPENNANIWILLLIFRRLIIWTELTIFFNIDSGFFPNTLNSKKAKTYWHSAFVETFHKRGMSPTAHNSELETLLVFKPSTLLSWKV